MSQRYLGNKKKKEVHDLWNVKPRCQIDEIKEKVAFSTLEEAKAAGYDSCAHCLSGSQR
jgi:hypothetical protein